jgi:GWxTD domain-containing protein
LELGICLKFGICDLEFAQGGSRRIQRGRCRAVSQVDFARLVNYNPAMKKTVFLIMLTVLLAVESAGQDGQRGKKREFAEAEKTAYKELDAKYRNWLDMITYITYAEERKVFLKLTNDRDREAFINIFWLQRDPTPGTPENEFKAEIEKRFAYVNDYFKRGSARPGWMTDQGRIYMILGKPNSQERFDEKAGLYPVQVWYFYGDSSLGLPTYFNIVFYKRFGAGEWKLYNPALDGPGSLLIQDSPMDTDDYAAIYKKIYELAPTLAGPAISMIPNEMTENYRPSLRNNFIMASIYESPTKRLNVSYATNFLKYKGYVNIETSANFIDNSNLVSVTRDGRSGCDFVNVSVRPKKISLGYSDDKDKYFFNLNLNVSLRKGEKIIYQYAKNFEFYFEPDKVQGLEGGGVVVHDSFPVIPGDYQMVVFIENAVGKEFSYFDQAIHVPQPGQQPYLAKPIVGYKEESEDSNFFHTYKFLNKKLSVDTEKTFGLSDVPHLLVGVYDLTQEVWEKGTVEIELRGLNERLKFSRTIRQSLNEQPFAKNMHLILPIDKTDLRADYYELTMRLRGPAGALLDSKKTDFTISPIQKIAHPVETYKQILVDNFYFFNYALGQQFEGIGDLEKAELYFAKSVQDKPDFAEGIVAELTLANKLQKYAEVLAAVENLNQFSKFAFDYHLIKGTALFGLERFEPALDELLKANKIYNSDIRVLNLIGFSFFKLNDMAEALKAFEASLAVNGKQPLVDKLVAEIRGRSLKGPAGEKDKVK